LEKNKQSIIPVTLHDNKTDRQHISRFHSQKMVANLINSQIELLIYEGIKRSILRVFLSEMSFICMDLFVLGKSLKDLSVSKR